MKDYMRAQDDFDRRFNFLFKVVVTLIVLGFVGIVAFYAVLASAVLEHGPKLLDATERFIERH